MSAEEIAIQDAIKHDTGLFDSIKKYITTDLKDPHFAADEFEKYLKYAKGLFAVLIIIMAIVNHDTDFMKKSPKGQNAPGLFFFYETLLFAFCGAFGFAFIGAMRSSETDILKKIDWKFAGILFVVFAVLNVILQLSGILTIALPKEKDAIAEEEYLKALEEMTSKKPHMEQVMDGVKTSVFVLLGLVFFGLIVVLFVIAGTLRDTVVPAYGASIFSAKGYKFWIEAVVFGLAASLNFFASARWRTGEVDWSADSVEVALLFTKFFILHIMLQLSGVYNHIIFPPANHTQHFGAMYY